MNLRMETKYTTCNRLLRKKKVKERKKRERYVEEEKREGERVCEASLDCASRKDRMETDGPRGMRWRTRQQA